MPKETSSTPKATIARALGLLEEARDLIQQAIERRGHDRGGGVRRGPGCPYAKMLHDIDAFMAQCPSAIRAEGRPVRDSPVRVIALRVTCMAADAEDVTKSLFNPDSTQPSWYYDNNVPLGPIQVHDRAPTADEDAAGRECMDVET